ncbi:MAG: hypothetical protein HRT40_07145 [Campylobacteraceae bacterium]|nr:hypothetical protein [Campylobacteraceae bacterium]
MKSEKKDGDMTASLDVAMGIRTVLLVRLYSGKYLSSNSEKDGIRIQKEFDSL